MDWNDISDWVTGYQRQKPKSKEEKVEEAKKQYDRSWGDPNTGLPEEAGIEDANDPSDVYFAAKSLAAAPATTIMKTAGKGVWSTIKNKKNEEDKKVSNYRSGLSKEEAWKFDTMKPAEKLSLVNQAEKLKQQELYNKQREYNKAKGESYKEPPIDKLPSSELSYPTDTEGKQDILLSPKYKILKKPEEE